MVVGLEKTFSRLVCEQAHFTRLDLKQALITGIQPEMTRNICGGSEAFEGYLLMNLVENS